MHIKNKNIFCSLLIFLLLFVCALVFPYFKVLAQEVTPTGTVAPINYQLPYPGLLPDHPMYFLKAARERVISFFISNPVKKSEFDLLQADKRVGASYRLSQKGKLDLAQSTFSKGENYFEESINRARDAKSQGINVWELAKKLSDANEKHIDVLKDVENNFKESQRKKFSAEESRLKEFKKRVKELSK